MYDSYDALFFAFYFLQLSSNQKIKCTIPSPPMFHYCVAQSNAGIAAPGFSTLTLHTTGSVQLLQYTRIGITHRTCDGT